jgi:hypothetical protein
MEQAEQSGAWMVRELELLGLDSVKSFLKRRMSRHPPAPGARCANCDTELAGLYCHVCGQAADNHHRSLFTLIVEGFEGVFHLDGRLWRTLPPLFFQPGKLARDYIEGRLARHVPPFRTFLVSLLLFIFSAEAMIHHMQHEAAHNAAHEAEAGHDAKPDNAHGAAPESAASGSASSGTASASSADAHGAPPAVSVQDGVVKTNSDTIITAGSKAPKKYNTRDLFAMDASERKQLADGLANETPGDKGLQVNIGGLNVPLAKAIENPCLFIMSIFTWGHRVAVLLLPIMSLVLGALYVYKRQFYIFDHFLVACNLLSFIFLTNALGFVLPEAVRGLWFFALMIWTPVNIFMTLRGAYGSGIFGALIKTLILWTATTVSFIALVIGLVILAASTMV